MSPRRRTSVLMWFGLLGAPAAWVVQFVFGYAVTEAACDAAGTKWGIPVDAWAAAHVAELRALVATDTNARRP